MRFTWLGTQGAGLSAPQGASVSAPL
ncbi:protein of unknown function [Cupriavidus taiwanensis]|uniref:Uncharacterized protein n=1 Tax=Cupriavidus taiwanensis TaxID=164546 RepID=A0A9Q7UWQ0_9BURK|nr:protein of unknown function [Cupriavidus taiwanensis]